MILHCLNRSVLHCATGYFHQMNIKYVLWTILMSNYEIGCRQTQIVTFFMIEIVYSVFWCFLAESVSGYLLLWIQLHWKWETEKVCKELSETFIIPLSLLGARVTSVPHKIDKSHHSFMCHFTTESCRLHKKIQTVHTIVYSIVHKNTTMLKLPWASDDNKSSTKLGHNPVSSSPSRTKKLH